MIVMAYTAEMLLAGNGKKTRYRRYVWQWAGVGRCVLFPGVGDSMMMYIDLGAFVGTGRNK